MSSVGSATTLYDKLGGKLAIEVVVGEFYKRVLADPELNGYFTKTDMEKQMRHQINFLTFALGGPNNYTGHSMKKAHDNLGITNDHFDLVAGHLVGTLKWAGVAQSYIDEVVAIVAPLKPEIVSAWNP